MKSLCGMLALLAFTACSNNDDDTGSGNGNHFWSVTLQASMGSTATRALSEESGNTIIASFAQNDEVVVVDADGSTIVGTLKAKTTGENTILEGTLDASSLQGEENVKLYYLSEAPNYDGQAGTLADIASYAEGILKVQTVNPLTFTSNSVTLAPRQSITKFSFTDGTNPVCVKTFGIAAPGLVQSVEVDGDKIVGAVTGTLATASYDVYVALHNNTGSQQTYSFFIKDDAGNWYTGKKNANLADGKNYAATVVLNQLASLSGSSAVGEIGVIDGLPAIAIGGSKAVALMNVGALCPEHYGQYYTFANRASGLSGSWYVPTKSELEELASLSSAWGAPNGVNGRTFTLGSNSFFLPAAGLDDGDDDPHDFLLVSEYGYYWSSSMAENVSMAYCLTFSSFNINCYSDYQIDGLTVRPFHTLNYY